MNGAVSYSCAYRVEILLITSYYANNYYCILSVYACELFWSPLVSVIYSLNWRTNFQLQHW